MSPWRRFLSLEKTILAGAGGIFARGWRWLLLIAALACTAALLLHVFDPGLRVWLRSHRDPGLIVLSQQLGRWGELHMAPMIALALLAAAGWWRKNDAWLRGAIAGVHAGVAGGIVVNILKVIAARPRPSTPYPDGFYWFRQGWDFASFPSGHATHCFAIVAAVALFAPRYAGLLTVGALGVVWSRWYLERHYVTDLFSGAMLGLTLGVILGLAVRRAFAAPGRPHSTEVPQEARK